MYIAFNLHCIIIVILQISLAACLDSSYSPCPLYENTTIIEQPVNFLTLHDKYVSAATSFIKRESGKGIT